MRYTYLNKSRGLSSQSHGGVSLRRYDKLSIHVLSYNLMNTYWVLGIDLLLDIQLWGKKKNITFHHEVYAIVKKTVKKYQAKLVISNKESRLYTYGRGGKAWQALYFLMEQSGKSSLRNWHCIIYYKVGSVSDARVWEKRAPVSRNELGMFWRVL